MTYHAKAMITKAGLCLGWIGGRLGKPMFHLNAVMVWQPAGARKVGRRARVQRHRAINMRDHKRLAHISCGNEGLLTLAACRAVACAALM